MTSPGRNFHLACLLVAAALAGSSGCCLWRQQSPVSEQVVLSRQYAQQGVNELARNNLSEAERYCAQAVRAAPDDAAVRMHYADVLWAQNRRNLALEQIESAVDKQPNDTEVLLRAASMHLEAGRTDAALSEVQRVIDVKPKSAEAWCLRGRVHRQAGDSRRALADWQRALMYEPRMREALRLSADLYREFDEPNRALVNYQALSDTFQPGEEQPDICVAQALTLAALGRHSDAAEQLEVACRRDPGRPELLLLLAEAESAAGRGGAAFAAAERAVAAAPNDERYRAAYLRMAAAQNAGGNMRR
jgi:tetratricopeptide (TPR) repeat protein